MEATTRFKVFTPKRLALLIIAVTLLSSCTQAQSQQTPSIKIDGSSTVYPITNAITSEYQATQTKGNKTNIEVDISGTGGGFRKFCEGVIDISNASRPILKDDNALVQGVSQDPNALGYFGFAYYEANSNRVKALAIDNGQESVLPSRQTVEKAQYQPLSRPLFIYINFQAAQNKSQVREFVDFYLQKAPTLVDDIGYISLPAEGYHLAKVHFNRGKVGTVFGGEAQLNLTLSELLRKQATF